MPLLLAFSHRPGMMRMRLRKRKPSVFWFLCCVRFIEVFPLGSQPPGTKPAVTGRSDRAIVNDIIPFGPSANYFGFVSACHKDRKVKSAGSVAAAVNSLKRCHSLLQRYTTNTTRSFQDLILPLSVSPAPPRYSTHFPTCSGPNWLMWIIWAAALLFSKTQ